MKYSVGQRFSANIMGEPAVGKIQIENDRVYLCQNTRKGDRCSDTLGYKYSWVVDSGSELDLSINSITDFSVSPIDPETYMDWQVGDKIIKGRPDVYAEVIFRSGKLVVLEYANNSASGNFTCEELFNAGWRLVVEEPEEGIIEVTAEEALKIIAQAKNMSVESLRIKK